MNGIPGWGLRMSRLCLTEAGLAAATRDWDQDRPAAERMIVNRNPNFILLFQPGGAQGFKSKENIFSSQQFMTKEAKQYSTDFSSKKQSRGVF